MGNTGRKNVCGRDPLKAFVLWEGTAAAALSVSALISYVWGTVSAHACAGTLNPGYAAAGPLACASAAAYILFPAVTALFRSGKYRAAEAAGCVLMTAETLVLTALAVYAVSLCINCVPGPETALICGIPAAVCTAAAAVSAAAFSEYSAELEKDGVNGDGGAGKGRTA